MGVAASIWWGSVANFRKIMILVLEGRSYGEIVEVAGCSRRDVSLVKKTVAARGISAGAAGSMTEAEVQALFPDGRRRVSEEYERPDYAAVLKSMKANRHFTLQQAWRKYVGAGGQGKKYGYSQYCHLFGEHLRVNDLVATLQHEPGRAMLVDWAGDTINLGTIDMRKLRSDQAPGRQEPLGIGDAQVVLAQPPQTPASTTCSEPQYHLDGPPVPSTATRQATPSMPASAPRMQSSRH